jgi:hypothetical protein
MQIDHKRRFNHCAEDGAAVQLKGAIWGCKRTAGICNEQRRLKGFDITACYIPFAEEILRRGANEKPKTL